MTIRFCGASVASDADTTLYVEAYQLSHVSGSRFHWGSVAGVRRDG